MKRYPVFALALLLGCTMFTGCRRNGAPMETIVPTTMVTETPTVPTTLPTTTPTTLPATESATHDAGTEDTGSSAPDATEESTGSARSRSGVKRPAMG